MMGVFCGRPDLYSKMLHVLVILHPTHIYLFEDDSSVLHTNCFCFDNRKFYIYYLRPTPVHVAGNTVAKTWFLHNSIVAKQLGK